VASSEPVSSYPSPHIVKQPRDSQRLTSSNIHVRLDFLGVLFIVWGVLTILIGLSTLALGVGAVALLASASRPASFAASFTAGAFTTLAIIALIWGGAHVAVGIPLRRRRHWARLGALMLGSVDLVLLPYGTALGIFALWFLLREDGKKLFEISLDHGR
jgi:hypothetical protein